MSRKLPEKILTDEEEEKFLEQFNLRYPTGLRNYCMCKLMMNLGLRVAEVTNLEVEHVNLVTYEFFVKESKGAKDRKLWFNQELANDIKDWLEERKNIIESRGDPRDVQREKGVEERNIKNYMFITHNSTPVKTAYMRNMVKRKAREAEIQNWKKISPHTFRHSFATKYYNKTRDIEGLSDHLGHGSLKPTRIYIHLAEGDRKDSLQEYMNSKRGVVDE